MNRENFFRKYDKIVAGFGDTKPSILLHSCCGPCSSSVIELLSQHFDVTVLSCDPMVRKGDYIALENFDQEHSYVINYSVILRFKGLRVLQPQQPKSIGGKSL